MRLRVGGVGVWLPLRLRMRVLLLLLLTRLVIISSLLLSPRLTRLAVASAVLGVGIESIALAPVLLFLLVLVLQSLPSRWDGCMRPRGCSGRGKGSSSSGRGELPAMLLLLLLSRQRSAGGSVRADLRSVRRTWREGSRVPHRQFGADPFPTGQASTPPRPANPSSITCDEQNDQIRALGTGMALGWPSLSLLLTLTIRPSL